MDRKAEETRGQRNAVGSLERRYEGASFFHNQASMELLVDTATVSLCFFGLGEETLTYRISLVDALRVIAGYLEQTTCGRWIVRLCS